MSDVPPPPPGQLHGSVPPGPPPPGAFPPASSTPAPASVPAPPSTPAPPPPGPPSAPSWGGGGDPPPPGAGPTTPSGSSGGGNGALIGVIAFVAVVAVAALAAWAFGVFGGDDEIADDPVVTQPDTTTPATSPDTVPDTVPDAVPDTTAPPTTPPETSSPTTLAEPAVPSPSDLARSVVQIQLLLDGEVTCSGSGTIVGADGTVLTNSHVIAQNSFCPHDRIGVAVLDLPERPPQLLFEADVLVDEPGLDLAVIRIARALDGSPIDADFPVATIGDSDTLQLGDRLNVIGYPGIGGETITFTEGTISGFVSVPGLGDRSWLKTDATLAGGNSGGMAVDLQGRLVGVPTIVGTGGGNITDCRFVADTNGDGVVDQNDACVPVGGFINGIRPVNLAFPLLEQARTATPIDRGGPMVDAPVPDPAVASDPVWTLDVEDGVALSPTVLPPAGAPQLCLTWNYANVPNGAPFEVVWFIDGVLEPDATVTGTNGGDTSGGFFACITNDQGLAPGAYEMGWFVDDQPVFSEGVYVGGDRFEIVLEVINETDTALCVVQFAPASSLTFGLNRLIDPIPPGGSFVVRLASGVYDRRVFDCDGALLDEDIGGTELFEDSTYTLSPT